MNNFCVTEMSVLTSYRSKKIPLLPQVCEFGVRLMLDHTLDSQAVLCFSETHGGLGASSGTCTAFLAPLCPPFSMWWLNLPCPLPLSHSSLIWTSDISSADFVLLNKAEDGQVHYTCFEWKKVLNFLFPSLPREIHWTVLMQHPWPACCTVFFVFSLLSFTTWYFFLLPSFALHCLLCIFTSLLLSPIPSFLLPSFSFCLFLFFFPLPMHFPDVLPCVKQLHQRHL